MAINALIANPMIADTRNFGAPIQYQRQQNALAAMQKPSPGYEGNSLAGGNDFSADGGMDRALKIASSAVGLNETTAKSALTDYLRTGGVNIDPATRAWCADFVNATLAQAGQTGTGSGMARSFEKWGREVGDPRPGDLAVFWRESPTSGKGHVGFFQGYNDDGSIKVLGGNQGDAVSVSNYPRNELLSFRRYGV